jgi:hypothetical protein
MSEPEQKEPQTGPLSNMKHERLCRLYTQAGSETFGHQELSAYGAGFKRSSACYLFGLHSIRRRIAELSAMPNLPQERNLPNVPTTRKAAIEMLADAVARAKHSGDLSSEMRGLIEIAASFPDELSQGEQAKIVERDAAGERLIAAIEDALVRGGLTCPHCGRIVPVGVGDAPRGSGLSPGDSGVSVSPAQS